MSLLHRLNLDVRYLLHRRHPTYNMEFVYYETYAELCNRFPTARREPIIWLEFVLWYIPRRLRHTPYGART